MVADAPHDSRRPTSDRVLLFLSTGILAVAIAACGGGDGDAASSGTSSASADEAADTTTPAADIAEPDDGSPVEANDDGTVTIEDATGEVTIPVTDQGVYVLDEIAALTMLILDVEPIGVELFAEDGSSQRIFEAEGLDAIPSGSLEPLAAAKPDLILGISHPRSTRSRDEHLEIAPVLYPDFPGRGGPRWTPSPSPPDAPSAPLRSPT